MAARRGTGLARWPLRLAWCCYVLCRAAWALDSRTCREVVTEAYRRHQDDKAHCEDVLCGRLDAPADAQGFLSRLTPQCRDVMARYRFRCTCCEHGRSAVRRPLPPTTATRATRATPWAIIRLPSCGHYVFG